MTVVNFGSKRLSTQLALSLSLSLWCSGAGFVSVSASGLHDLLGNTHHGEAQHPTVRDKWALVIGVDSFQDTSIPPNKQGAADARAVTKVLTEPMSGHFAADHVVTLTEKAATKSGIEHAVDEWLVKKPLPDDLIVIYISSRAAKEKDGSPLVYTYDTLASEANLSAINVKRLVAEIKQRTQSQNIVCLLDTSPVRSAVAPDYRTLTTAVITYISATDGDQASLENGVAGTSVFVHHLAEGLRLDGGTWTLQQIFDHVARSVANDAQTAFHKVQTPVLMVSPTNPAIAQLAIGQPVKSSSPRPTIGVGHPVDRLAIDHPELSEPRLGTGNVKPIARSADAKPAQAKAAAPKTADKDEDDDDDGRPDVDFSGYMTKMKTDIQKHWHPPKGLESRRITATFTITRDGRILNPNIIEGSGLPELDKSALQALSEASPLDPLPPGAPRSVDIKYKFDWTVH